jgi:hypothetical protein
MCGAIVFERRWLSLRDLLDSPSMHSLSGVCQRDMLRTCLGPGEPAAVFGHLLKSTPFRAGSQRGASSKPESMRDSAKKRKIVQ